MPKGDNGFDKRPADTKLGGRPKGSKSFASVITYMLDQNNNMAKIIDAMIEKAQAGDVRAVEWLSDRRDGKPIATIQHGEIPTIKLLDATNESHQSLQEESTEPSQDSNQ